MANDESTLPHKIVTERDSQTMESECTLPDEIIIEILSRLPVKSLLRFRCVCKPWCSLFKDPYFIQKHLERSIENNNHHSLILRRYYLYSLYSVDLDACDKVVELDHPLKTPTLATVIAGSCNGLLCLYDIRGEVVLWNPFTRQYKKVPVSPIGIFRRYGRSIVLGFGYDPITGDYKVVRIAQLFEIDSQVMVYSLNKNSWKRIQDFPYNLIDRSRGILASNAIHWVASRTHDPNVSKLIVSFDLRDEECREVPLPEILGDKKFSMAVEVLAGSLCMFCHYRHFTMDIWMMKDYGVKESWTKLFSITHEKMVFGYLRPIVLSKDGRVLIEHDGGKLLWHDPRNQKVKYLKISGMPNSYDAVIFVGSLVPLNDGVDGQQEKQTL